MYSDFKAAVCRLAEICPQFKAACDCLRVSCAVNTTENVQNMPYLKENLIFLEGVYGHSPLHIRYSSWEGEPSNPAASWLGSHALHSVYCPPDTSHFLVSSPPVGVYWDERDYMCINS